VFPSFEDMRAIMQKNELQIVNPFNTESMLTNQFLPQKQQLDLTAITLISLQLFDILVKMAIKLSLLLVISMINQMITWVGAYFCSREEMFEQ